MTTRGPIVPIAQPQQQMPLCDFCHQKPKFSNHQYCSKTCATQASALCNQCHKKAKFQGFDYCSKKCAGLTSSAAPRAQAAVAANPLQQQQAQAPKANLPKPPNAVQAAIQALISSNGASTTSSTQPAGQAVASVAAPPIPQSNNPFHNLTNQQQQPQQVAGNGCPAQGPMISQPPAPPLPCLIQGCGKPVYIDSQGNSTDYCSKKHREDAVASGLVPPCIMCLTMPQTNSDYFCGKACRDEANCKV